MSLSDTIDAIIKESSSVERELRWFLSALPAIVSTEPCGHGVNWLTLLNAKLKPLYICLRLV